MQSKYTLKQESNSQPLCCVDEDKYRGMQHTGPTGSEMHQIMTYHVIFVAYKYDKVLTDNVVTLNSKWNNGTVVPQNFAKYFTLLQTKADFYFNRIGAVDTVVIRTVSSEVFGNAFDDLVFLKNFHVYQGLQCLGVKGLSLFLFCQSALSDCTSGNTHFDLRLATSITRVY